jgi:hypothetical protein
VLDDRLPDDSQSPPSTTVFDSFSDSALVAGTRRAETRPFVAQGETFQNGLKGNAQYSNLQPNGKIKKQKDLHQPPVKQLSLFGGSQ